LGLDAEESSIGGLMKAATPEARRIIANTTEIWQKFRDQYPETDITRCHLSITLRFSFKSGLKSLGLRPPFFSLGKANEFAPPSLIQNVQFTFSHMGERRQIVFIREGDPDSDSTPRIHDPQARQVYRYDGSRWESEGWNLSAREYNILHLTAQGWSVKEIADKMNLSADTVNFHKKKIFKKMGTANTMGALASFVRRTGMPLGNAPIVINEICLPDGDLM
ncbi:MAG: LuxR C-terminal-related transcriptional regulator, partial [Marinilabiliaceae bacterium]